MELRRITMTSLKTNYVCRDCVLALQTSTTRAAAAQTRSWTSSRRSLSTTTTATTTQRPSTARLPLPLPLPRIPPRRQDHHTVRRLATASGPPADSTLDLNAIHARIQELSASILRPDADNGNGNAKLPSDQRVLYVFEQLQSIAASILDERRTDPSTKPESAAELNRRRRGATAAAATPAAAAGQGRRNQETATSALLGSVNARQRPVFVSRDSILTMLSDKALEIVRHPDVFITSPVLQAYVDLQSFLQQPWSFPDLFEAYARKPAPTLKGNAVEYSPVSPNHINAAIDAKTANAALSAAMLAQNLPLAIDIITTSFCTPAFKKAKILKQAAIPIAGLALAPVGAYTLSSALAPLMPSLDPSVATGMVFAGIMTYIGVASTMGYITITTANDQMDRITWAMGVPLWERWVREDERAAADRVAAAWGFKDRDRRGEEEGKDWDSLREWVGRRGMILDRVNLMDGME